MVVLDGLKQPSAVIETVELTQRRFSDVDRVENSAVAQGESVVRNLTSTPRPGRSQYLNWAQGLEAKQRMSGWRRLAGASWKGQH